MVSPRETLNILGAGLGLKPQHYQDAYAAAQRGLWFEVHPENYLVEGGPRLAWLETIRARHPVSLHGVSLSLAADKEPDTAHLRRLGALIERIEPVLMSEHLAWSAWKDHYHPDLLPFPRTQEALLRVAANISRTQDALGRRIAIENPTHYLTIPGHDWSEIDFLKEVVRRTGCGLLVDVNNIFVSAHNLTSDPIAYLDAIPPDAVMEIHLAGHSVDAHGALLIDSHDAAINDGVWRLYRYLIDRIGTRPTLIERDDNVPGFETLLDERRRAQSVLDAVLVEAIA
jgi:Uncharacterized protein conserved in bacteria